MENDANSGPCLNPGIRFASSASDAELPRPGRFFSHDLDRVDLRQVSPTVAPGDHGLHGGGRTLEGRLHAPVGQVPDEPP